jgi:hypothetical protein
VGDGEEVGAGAEEGGFLLDGAGRVEEARAVMGVVPGCG